MVFWSSGIWSKPAMIAYPPISWIDLLYSHLFTFEFKEACAWLNFWLLSSNNPVILCAYSFRSLRLKCVWFGTHYCNKSQWSRCDVEIDSFKYFCWTTHRSGSPWMRTIFKDKIYWNNYKIYRIQTSSFTGSLRLRRPACYTQTLFKMSYSIFANYEYKFNIDCLR